MRSMVEPVQEGYHEGDRHWRHICVDAQRMFAEDTPWYVPWMARVFPQLLEVSGQHSERTVFTGSLRHIVRRMPSADGRTITEKWWMMTGEQLPQELVGLASPLQKLVPPGWVFDKMTYSPWVDGRLFSHLRQDVCVRATVLGAIDLGFHVIVLSDAVCSGADETHDAAVDLLGDRFSVQLELVETEEFLSAVSR
jgi:nicotinamidase-related amidase